jgi:hypothetical protein
MKEECSQHCDSDKVETILSRLLGGDDEDSSTSIHGPIQWLDEGSFSAAALGRIYNRIFMYLPYYIKNMNELEQGIMVPGTMGPVKTLYNPISILVLEDNVGCSVLVDEIKSLVSQRECNLISVMDASVVLLHGRSETDIEINVHTNLDIDEENLLSNTEDSASLGSSTKSQTFMLLYLNNKTFTGSNEYITILANTLKACQTNDSIQLVLVQEKDLSKGGCDFDLFFSQAPQELINPPFTIFRDIAIPLYGVEEYRAVSLGQILSKMGASERSPNGGLMTRIRSCFGR